MNTKRNKMAARKATKINQDSITQPAQGVDTGKQDSSEMVSTNWSGSEENDYSIKQEVDAQANSPAKSQISGVKNDSECVDMSEDEDDTLAPVWRVQSWAKDVDGEESWYMGMDEDTECYSPNPHTASPSVNCDGSDIDTEDEFDLSNMRNTSPGRKPGEIPDQYDLDESIWDTMKIIVEGIDDEADGLLGKSSDFKWVEGFDTFKGVPEQFTGPTPGPIRDYDSAYDAFVDIWDDVIVQQIVLETNRYAKQTIDALKENGQMPPSSRVLSWTDTNTDELLVLLAVFIYMGIDNRTSLPEYWQRGVLGMAGFRNLMTYSRYTLLNKFLHFVDNSTRTNNVSQPRENTGNSELSPQLFKLSPIIDHLENKFSSLYNLSRNVCIDESLTLFKGRLSWVQAISTKAAKFGIKSYELCESRTGYMSRFQIYTGKMAESCEDQDLVVYLGSKSTKVVVELLSGLEHRGHCVTMDNFYNCPSLARYLKSLGFDCFGTLRRNHRNVPKDIASLPKNLPRGTMVSRHCGDLSIVSWQDCRLVSIISTYHDDSTYVGTRGGKAITKPVCVKEYNQTMGGIDLKDQKLSMYMIERKRGMKWYIKMFKRLLNISIHNAYIMYKSSLERRGKKFLSHREFRYQLADTLVEKHRRLTLPLDVSLEEDECTRLRRDIQHEPQYVSGNKGRKRCCVCLQQNIRKMVHSRCCTCNVYLCFKNCWQIWHTTKKLGLKRTRRKRKD